jgi:hypothetical protein
MARTQDKNVFLIVSGSTSRIKFLSAIFNSHYPGCSIFHAADWFDTKYKIDNLFPKFMFIDEYLPKGSGLDIAGKVLKEKNNANIQLVIMTIVADHDHFENEPSKKRIQFLTEPENESAVLACLSPVLGATPAETQPHQEYTLRHLHAGELLFAEGEEAKVVYIVKNGTLRAYSDSISGARVTLGDITAGEFVGEMGHFNHEPRSATVEALSDVELVEIPLNSLENVIFSKPSWAKALVKTLSLRLRRANKVLTG